MIDIFLSLNQNFNVKLVIAGGLDIKNKNDMNYY